MKNFARHACKNILPTLSNLKKRGVVGMTLMMNVEMVLNLLVTFYGVVGVQRKFGN